MVQGSLPGLVAAKVNECFEHNLHRFVMDIDQLKEEQKSKARDKAKVCSMDPGHDQCTLLVVHLYWMYTQCVLLCMCVRIHIMCVKCTVCVLCIAVCVCLHLCTCT